MRIPVVIDGCAWNVLFTYSVDIGAELPADRFSLSMPREVDIEIAAIEDTEEKAPLKAFISASFAVRQPEVTWVFGFAEAQPPGTPQIYGGFDQGAFASAEELAYRARPEVVRHVKGKPLRPKTGLTKNQADVSLAVSSLSAVVITADKKNGPLPNAVGHGGMVVILPVGEDPSGRLDHMVTECWTRSRGGYVPGCSE